MDELSTFIPNEGSSSKRTMRLRTGSFTSREGSSQTAFQAGWTPVQRTPTFFNRPPSAGIRSNASDTDRSDIIAPIPRRHSTLERNESQHWLGSPPLSPISVISRAVSPLPSTPVGSRRKHSRSFSATLQHDGRHSYLSVVPQVRSPPEKSTVSDSSTARRWARWMHKQGLKQWVIPITLVVSALVKWCIGLGSYSGQDTPPMFGDYEAQRHWMELTLHLPFRHWYTYDLQYWGLDYPPLTAYISWLCGFIGSWINSTWFALDASRGIEDPGSKVFMRATVLVFDFLVYCPAVVLFTKIWQGNRSSRAQHVSLLTLLLQPALLLIDFGHFQYNSVMLGFTLLSMDFFAQGRDLLGAICFVLSLGFKQMALYYAPAIGSYLIAKCLSLGPAEGVRLFIRLAIVTIASFVILFLPFLPPFAPMLGILDPVTRIFPFARGLFEDKVANFWCASNVAFKWKIWMSRETLVKLSTALTATGFLPSVIGLIYSGYRLGASEQPSLQTSKEKSAPPSMPLLPLLPYALLASSMSFFLFSFQVHEKTILVPLLPLTLLLSGSATTSSTFQLGVLVNNVAMFSMWPLLKRDGLALQYIVAIVLWNRLIGYNPFRQGSKSLMQYASLAIYAACFALHLIEARIPPPTHLPDLYSVLNVLISTPVFAFTWLWSIKRGVEVGWAIGGLGSKSPAGGSALLTPSASYADGDKHFRSAAEIPSSGSSFSNVSDKSLKRRSLGFAQGRKVSSSNSLRTGRFSAEPL